MAAKRTAEGVPVAAAAGPATKAAAPSAKAAAAPAAKRKKPAETKKPAFALGSLMQSAATLDKELSSHALAKAKSENAVREKKSEQLRGKDLIETFAGALADLRVAASGASSPVELEARIGMACDQYAEVGSSEAPSRSNPGRRGCGAVELREGYRFVPGVSSLAFHGAAERLLAMRGTSKAEDSSEYVFGGDEDGLNERLCFAAGKPWMWKLEKKETLHKTDYGLPSAHYDLRIQSATEKAVGAGSSAAEYHSLAESRDKPKKWTWQRFKRRKSTVIGGVWRVDATEVTHRSYPIDILTTEQAAALAMLPEPPLKPPSNVPAFHEEKITYELELELLGGTPTKTWLSRGNEVTDEDRHLAEKMTSLLSLLNPLERMDTRPVPTTPATPELKAACLEVMSHKLKKGRSNYFPGAMPIGFTRRSIPQLQREEYFAAEKSDGERRLLVVTESRDCVFVDRSLRVELVKLTKSSTSALQPGTILDGEVVQNLEIGRAVFLIFDVLCDGKTDLTPMNFERRFWGALSRDGLADALAVPCRRDPPSASIAAADDARLASVLETVDSGDNVVLLIPKRFSPTSRISAQVLGQIIKSGDAGGQVKWGSRVYRDGRARCHLSDGIIFVPNAPYVSGTDPRLLKWKWQDGLTVDLEVRGAGKGGDLSLHACGDDGEAVDCSRHVILAEHDAARLRADVKAAGPGGTVAEVGLDSRTGLWEYHGLRPDKQMGNHFDVFVSTLLLHAESPEELELEYRLRADNALNDDWDEQLSLATRKAASYWVECFSQTQSKPYWWNRKTNEKSWAKPPGHP